MGNVAAGGEGGEEDFGGKVPAKGRVRDMSLPQLALYDGEGGEKAHAYVGIRGEIFDVTNILDKEEGAKVRADYGAWFGKNKEDATEEELEDFRSKYCKLGNVIEQRVISPEELAKATGESGAPIYIAARGLVFDVSSGESFYGPGGGYHLFAGHNAQRALALMSLKPEDVVNTSLDGLDPKDLKILDEWIEKYYQKYPLIGTLSDAGSGSSATSNNKEATQPGVPAPTEASKGSQEQPVSKEEETSNVEDKEETEEETEEVTSNDKHDANPSTSKSDEA